MNLCFIRNKLTHVKYKKCLHFNIILKLKIIVPNEKLLGVNETKF